MATIHYTARNTARTLVEAPYLILSRLVPEGVQIVRILHGAGNIDGMPAGEQID